MRISPEQSVLIEGDWVRLGDHAEIVSGVTKGQKYGGRQTVDVPYLRVANVQDGYLNLSEIKTIRALPEEVETLRLQPGDVVMTEGGDFDKLGRGAIWQGGVQDCIHQNHIFRVRLDPSVISPSFFVAFLQSDSAKGYFLRCSKQTTNLASINLTQLRETPVPHLSLSDQNRITAQLEQADRLRRTRRYALELSDTFLPAAFLQLFGDTATLWRKWSRKSFGEVLRAELRNGLSPSKSGVVLAKVLTLSAITGSNFKSEALKVARFVNEPPQDKRVSTEDFLICRGNGNLEMVGRAKFSGSAMPDVVFPDTMIAARVHEKLLARHFLQAIWKTPFVRKQIEASARTTNGTFKINQEALSDIELPVPPLPLQEEFALLVARQERLHAVQRESLRQSEHLFYSLLQVAFSSRS